ncbi:hypothetical protein BC332_28277 [Capsicum chinense]|nr:hypothetical protein BC332_28277 [Capsicum chinense]
MPKMMSKSVISNSTRSTKHWKWHPAEFGSQMKLTTDGTGPVDTHLYLSEKLPNTFESDHLSCHTRNPGALSLLSILNLGTRELAEEDIGNNIYDIITDSSLSIDYEVDYIFTGSSIAISYNIEDIITGSSLSIDFDIKDIFISLSPDIDFDVDNMDTCSSLDIRNDNNYMITGLIRLKFGKFDAVQSPANWERVIEGIHRMRWAEHVPVEANDMDEGMNSLQPKSSESEEATQRLLENSLLSAKKMDKGDEATIKRLIFPVMIMAWNKVEGICVATHMHRVSNWLG